MDGLCDKVVKLAIELSIPADKIDHADGRYEIDMLLGRLVVEESGEVMIRPKNGCPTYAKSISIDYALGDPKKRIKELKEGVTSI